MTEQETENRIDELKTENQKLVATCHDLASQLDALRKRVHRIEADFYKDIVETDLDV